MATFLSKRLPAFGEGQWEESTTAHNDNHRLYWRVMASKWRHPFGFTVNGVRATPDNSVTNQ